MWRYLAGGMAALLLVAAGLVLTKGRTPVSAPLAAQPLRAAQLSEPGAPLPDRVPEASARTREEKRFDRYDKDRDGTVTRAEYLASRRKAYARLDVNGDGVLTFDEWAVKATTKFAAADRDKSGAMTASEFATTAVKRTARRRVNCPPAPRGEES